MTAIAGTGPELRLPPQIRSALGPIIAALRLGAVMFGMAFASPDAARGNLRVVFAVAIVLFFTSWRTFRPNQMGTGKRVDRILVSTDAVVLGVAVGISDGFQSPFVFCVVAAGLVAAFGWGTAVGMGVIALSGLSIVLTALVTDGDVSLGSQLALVVIVSTILATALAGFARERLLDAERRRVKLTGRIDALSETNELLQILNQVARTLPTSLDLRDALQTARKQIRAAFDPTTICLLVRDDMSPEWIPKLTDGCAVAPSATIDELPDALQRALANDGPIVIEDLSTQSYSGIEERSGSGVYTAIKTRDRTVGVLGVEHTEVGHFSDRDRQIIAGLGEVLALTVDNSRYFQRLRSLGAEEERSRIARDLHDRLGQWLTYISFELERILGVAPPETADDLTALHTDVQTAVSELRETLRQLRSSVSEDLPFSVVARELIERFVERTDIEAEFDVANAGERLPVPIENEILRILQEALSNVDKHAEAETITVRWVVADGKGVLAISDDGCGFEPRRGVRDSAYGLVGMRERADVIGAQLRIESSPDEGTTITVVVSPDTRQENR